MNDTSYQWLEHSAFPRQLYRGGSKNERSSFKRWEQCFCILHSAYGRSCKLRMRKVIRLEASLGEMLDGLIIVFFKKLLCVILCPLRPNFFIKLVVGCILHCVPFVVTHC